VAIDDRKVVGFSLRVTGLTPEQSIKVQEQGIGGRRRMGCGLFRRSEKELTPDQRPAREDAARSTTAPPPAPHLRFCSRRA
jgi:hypothetical protein